LGGVAGYAGGNESSIAEVSDGSLLLSIRTKPWRVQARSRDGGESWSTDPIDSVLRDPACQGAVCTPADGRQPTVYFSNPSAPKRINMTIHASDDDGQHWPRSFQVYSGPSAYSDLVLLDRKHIGILYEAGIARPNEGIAFRVIATDDIK
jgi:sialidase-1